MSTVKSTEGRIFNFSIAESALMVCMAGLQVFIVRFFFQGARKGRYIVQSLADELADGVSQAMYDTPSYSDCLGRSGEQVRHRYIHRSFHKRLVLGEHRNSVTLRLRGELKFRKGRQTSSVPRPKLGSHMICFTLNSQSSRVSFSRVLHAISS